MSDAERIEQRRAKSREYEQREYRKEKRRQESRQRCRDRKIATFTAGFGELTLEELIAAAMLRCHVLGVDFEANKVALIEAMQLLHGSGDDLSESSPESISEEHTSAI